MSKKRRPSLEREQETGLVSDNWTDRAYTQPETVLTLTGAADLKTTA